MKNSTGVVVGVAVVALVVVGVWYNQNKNTSEYGEATSKSGGSLYVAVADASADISNVNNIDMSIKRVELHSAAKGWMTISSNEKKYALFSLKANGQAQLYAKKDNLESGIYDKVRVTLGDTIVHTKTKGDVKAVKPTSEVVMNTAVKVNADKNTRLKLDFLADKSLHTTSDGKYVFAPAVRAESRSNADVTVEANDDVKASGGTVDSDVSVGVDLSGSSRSDFQLDTDNSLKITLDTPNHLEFMLGTKKFVSDDSKDREDEMNDDMKSDSKASGVIEYSGKQENGSTSGSGQTDVKVNTNLNY